MSETRLGLFGLRHALLLLLAAGLALLLACDSASPVAPPGTLLTISANPARISSTSTSEIRVVARKPNGTPVNPGTLIQLSTTVGRVPASVPIDSSGEAVALLEGNGEFGAATVTASVAGAEPVMVDVQVGLTATDVSLQATPTAVPESGGVVDLLAQVRDEQGRPLEGANINFTTETGQLDSGGRILTTDSEGAATDRLVLSSGAVELVTGDNFEVGVEVGSGSGSLVVNATTLSILRPPRADFTFVVSGLRVVFTDTSTGRPTQWAWDFDRPQNQDFERDSPLQNPSFTYPGPGNYLPVLQATNFSGTDERSRPLTITGN